MTPTLLGRWETRCLMLLFIWAPVTFLYAWWLSGWDLGRLPPAPFIIVAALFVIGLVLDPLYIWLQYFRWDRDWPFAFQFAAMILEFVIVAGLIWLDLMPYLSARQAFPNASALWLSVLHFLLVFVPSFIALLGFFQIFLVRWRFKGGEWGRL